MKTPFTNAIFTRSKSDALTKLSGMKFDDMNLFMSVAKLKHEYDKAKTPFDNSESTLAREFCDRDDKGNPILGPKGILLFNQRRDEFGKKHDELMKQPVSDPEGKPIEFPKLTINISSESDLFSRDSVCAKCKEKMQKPSDEYLTSNDVAALMDFIEFKK